MTNFFEKNIDFKPEITHGICPTCTMPTMLISLTRDYYRCVSCGTDLEQKINGVIKYMPLEKRINKDQPKAE
jgi:tRNA(Ile2) C34 agmatinyltransferase TiaS